METPLRLLPASVPALLAAVVVPVLLGGCTAPPETRSFTLDSGDVSRSTAAVSEQGAWWSWIRRDDSGWNVYAAGWAPDTDQLEPVRVNHLDGNASPHAQAPAQVAVGPEGNVYVLWTNHIEVPERRFPASDLLFAASYDGGRSFTAERPINSDAGGLPTGHTFHNMLVRDDGTIVVSWIDGRAREKARAEAAGGSGGGAAPGPGAAAAHDTVGRAAAGGAVPAHGTVGHGAAPDVVPGSEIWVAVSTDQGRTFTETAVTDRNACPCCRTAMAAGPDGALYLGWRHIFDNGDRDMVLARSDDGGRTFDDFVRVAEDRWNIDACPHAGPSIAVETDGRVHVAWYTGVDDGVGLFHATSTDGGRSFQPKEPLLEDIGIAQVSLAPAAGDGILVAYEDTGARAVRTGPLGDATRRISGTLPSLASNRRFATLTWSAENSVVAEVWGLR